MYISIVEIDLPGDVDRDALANGFLISGHRYTNVPGLLRKYYTMDDSTITGGVFVWESQRHAVAGHSDLEWNKLILDKYGTQPKITYYDVPVVIDNVLGEICRGSEYLEAMGQGPDVRGIGDGSKT
jgi:hypothetical protein